MMHYLLILLIGYLLGCSNMAVYLAAAQNVDLRSGGSGNPGASNALILMGWRAGLLVGAHDIAKAVLAVLLCRLLFPAVALLLLLAVSLITLVTDYVVLGTMTTVISVPLYSAWSGSGTTALLLLPLSAIIIYKHRDNLVRICRGTEIGLRSAHRGDHRKSTQSGPPRP